MLLVVQMANQWLNGSRSLMFEAKEGDAGDFNFQQVVSPGAISMLVAWCWLAALFGVLVLHAAAFIAARLVLRSVL
jgi:hypothetical protein